MTLTIKDPSFVVMQNGRNLFDMGRVSIMGLFGDSQDFSKWYHYLNLGTEKIEIAIKTSNPSSKNLDALPRSRFWQTEFNNLTCLMRLPSITNEEAYTLIIQPISDEFNTIYGFYELFPLSKHDKHTIVLKKEERWPNGLVFKLVKTRPRDIDYVVSLI